MKLVVYKSVILLFSQLTLVTCAKDSEEKYTEEEEDAYIETMYEDVTPESAKSAAIADWETFCGDSEKLLAIAKSNLNLLHAQISETEGEHKLDAFYKKSENQYYLLKKQLAAEDKIFSGEPAKITTDAVTENKSFKSTFWTELIQLNTTLEDALENEFTE